MAKTIISTEPDMVNDIIKAFGLDPMRVTSLKFEWNAEDNPPHLIEVEMIPVWLGLPKEEEEDVT